jgi:dCTP deaminase
MDIRQALATGRLVIDPLPEEDQIDATAIDLRIGEPLWMWDPELDRPERETRVSADRLNFRELSEKYLVKIPRQPSGSYLIQPRRVVLAPTFEKVHLPAGSRLGGRVEGKSGLARLGLAVHMTAPMIHCGTELGIITLEVFNHGPFALEVTPGVSRICQLVLEEVSSEPEERTGRTFVAQKTPKG